MSSPDSAFDTIPNEVLEQIAFYAATCSPTGPPSDLLSLLLVNRRFAAALSVASTSYLYSRIFCAKFDADAYKRRLGPQATTAPKLAAELARRCCLLRRIRARTDCYVGKVPLSDEDAGRMHEMLWVAYLMMLENDGLNERQLREYAHLDVWLKDYWFDPDGASCATLAIKDNGWPPNNELSAVTMWLFWFLLRPEEYFLLDEATFRTVISILKLLALGAHQYPVSRPAWVDFLPEQSSGRLPPCYADYPPLVPPPLAAPAVLSYLSLAPRSTSTSETLEHANPLVPSSISSRTRMSREWDSEWKRCRSLAGAEAPVAGVSAGTFPPGAMEGIWEGLFTYTEFTAYAALLSGAPPPTLHKSLVARHQQTWRLREYHLLVPEIIDSENSNTANTEKYRPLTPGDPLRAYLPPGLTIEYEPEGIKVQEPSRPGETLYYRSPEPAQVTEAYAKRVREILITGEVRSLPLIAEKRVGTDVHTKGHSAWGQFSLIGRIRPSDGYVTLSKEYINGDRGKWLYRGYLVGDVHGNFAGRWRDTLSPPEVLGYEGCFFMGRRR
ncbi:hypothetical protein BV25DRAFT_1813403 [Artomyces pyxidatus]|uniref:Uncharacterized protein n=1 Tax=Artomyces pyxidatus TaxID=48021 RepID=A0ACB8SLR2_9AGAM|nr:hypothetical protein BV25DRAFT_1813403 [Artomyces pyxidatus]